MNFQSDPQTASTPFSCTSQLAETDLMGRFFLGTRNKRRAKGYYAAIKVLRPLLKSKEWNTHVTGFFINSAGDYNAVRLSYFTADGEATVRLVDGFLKRSKLTHVDEPKLARPNAIARFYGQEELRFRRFLTVSTLIGLDLMANNLRHSRRLLATYRWQVLRNRFEHKRHFERSFMRGSPLYRSFSEEEKEQLWSDLMHWPNPPQVDWAHMFVNMILSFDWLGVWRSRLPPVPIGTNKQVELLLKDWGIRIPRRWHP